MIKPLILLTLAAIIVSLGSGLFHLVKDEGQSKRMVTALTIRVALSVLLFVLLLLAWRAGLIEPNDCGDAPPPVPDGGTGGAGGGGSTGAGMTGTT